VKSSEAVTDKLRQSDPVREDTSTVNKSLYNVYA